MIQLDLGQPETLLCRQVVEQPAEVVEVFLAALNCNASMFVDNVLTMFVDSPELQCINVCWQSLLTMFVVVVLQCINVCWQTEQTLAHVIISGLESFWILQPELHWRKTST